MKPIIFIALFFFVGMVMGQSSDVEGFVIIFNSKYETGKIQYVENALVEDIDERANPYLTKADGYFKLLLIKVSDLESVALSVKKVGWEIINTDRLNAVGGQTDLLKLYMSLHGQIAENRRKYYKIGKTESEKKLEVKNNELQGQIAILKKSAEQNALRILELEREVVQLAEEKILIESNVMKLAERFSRVNLDEANERSLKAFGLFQKGDVGAALRLIHIDTLSNDVDRLNLMYEQGQHLISAGEILQGKAVDGLKKAADNYMLGANLSLLQYDFEGAEAYFKGAIKYDSTNSAYRISYGDFLFNQKRLTEAVDLYKQVIIRPASKSQKIEAQLKLANLFRLLKSKQSLYEYRSVIHQLGDDADLEALLQKGIAYNGLGNVYFNLLVKPDSANFYYTTSLGFKRELLKKDSSVLHFHEYLKTVENLIAICARMRACEKGEFYGLIAIEGYKKLSHVGLDYMDHYGKALVNYAMLFRHCSNDERALETSLSSIKVYKALVKKNPKSYEPDLALAYHNVSSIYDDYGDYKKAREYLELAFDIRYRYFKLYPDAYTEALTGTMVNLSRAYYLGYVAVKSADYMELWKKGKELLQSASDNLKKYKTGEDKVSYLRQIDYWNQKFGDVP
jgi:tetratricopeptide (TPR) repeat protein